MPTTFSHGYALLVGVGQSQYAPYSLPVTVKDTQALYAILTDPALCAYPADEQHVRRLHDAGATRQAILDGLAWLAEQAAADPEATVVVFYSGHGWLDRNSGRYYLIPHDVSPLNIAGSALSAESFTEALRQIRAKRLLVIIDSCYAQGMATSKDPTKGLDLPTSFVQAAAPKMLIEALGQGEGRVVFTSSRDQQFSQWLKDKGLSLYTFHLIEALHGADNKPGDTYVTVANLMHYVSAKVPQTALAVFQVEQTPFYDMKTEDFPVALLRGGKGLEGLAGASPDEVQQAARQAAAVTIGRLVQASGQGIVAIGGNVSGPATIVAGSGHTVGSGSGPVVGGHDNKVHQHKYEIDMPGATGVAIGDNARVTQHFGAGRPAEGRGERDTRPERCADLKESIQETQRVLQQYEVLQRLEPDAQQRSQLEQRVHQLREQLDGYTAEARKLGCQ